MKLSKTSRRKLSVAVKIIGKNSKTTNATLKEEKNK